MKNFILILFVILTFGCESQNQAKKSDPIKEDTKPKLLTKYDAFKISKGDNWNQNDIIEAKNNKELTDSLAVWIKEPDVLDDLEFKFKEIQQAQHEGGVINVGAFWLNVENSSMVIFGIVSDDLVDQLIDNHIYRLSGKYLEKSNKVKVMLTDSNYVLGSHRFNITGLEEI